jgi:hypothetical protein
MCGTSVVWLIHIHCTWYIYIYILSLICFVRMDFSGQHYIEGEEWDAMRNPFWAKHINDSTFIKDLVL